MHRTFLHTVPNTGPAEIDLSRLKPPSNGLGSEFLPDWRKQEKPSDLPGHSKA
jgi:hypothetical protein